MSARAKSGRKISLTTLAIFLLLPLIPLGTAANDGGSDVVIHMSEQGFSPARMEIPVGTTVSFQNDGDQLHWPAANMHPSHTGYDGTTLREHCAKNAPPSFDACDGILPGESWAFTFEEEGSHAYHDHLWPHMTGEIIVHGEQVPNPKRDVLGRMAEVYRESVRALGPDLAIRLLRERSAANNSVQGICHDMAHAIGKEAFVKVGSFGKAASLRADFCNSGYIHGVFEAYFASGEASVDDIASQCDQIVGTRPIDRWQCLHGIGHGLMYMTGGDLDGSLGHCGRVAHPSDADACYNGVYMELFNDEQLAQEVGFIEDGPLQACEERSVGQSHCYFYAPTYLVSRGESFAGAAALCEKLEGQHRRECVAGVGAEAMKRNARYFKSTFDLCADMPEIDRYPCAYGASGMHANQSSSLPALEELCRETVPGVFQEACWEAYARKREMFLGSM